MNTPNKETPVSPAAGDQPLSPEIAAEVLADCWNDRLPNAANLETIGWWLDRASAKVADR